MTQLPGVQILAGGMLTGGTTSFTSTSGANATGNRDGSLAWPPPAHLFITANLGGFGAEWLNRVTVGIGLTSPFGSVSRYADNGPQQFKAVFSALPLIDIKPTIAYQVTPDLSLGLGADIYTFSDMLGEGHFEKQFISTGAVAPSVLGTAGQKTELYGKGTAVGYNVSLLYTALRNGDGKPIANIGVVYRNQVALPLNGGILANGVKTSDASTTFVLPQVITGAIAIWPTRTAEREWKLELDVDYVGWKSVRNLDIALANGSIIPQPQNWRSTYTVMIGTEYRWLKMESLPEWELALRAGYMNSPSQIPDLTFDPAIPSADVHIPSVGFGLVCKEGGTIFGVRCGDFGFGPIKPKAVAFDLSYQASLYEQRTVSCGCALATAVNGLYRTTYHSGGISLRVNF
ncbi:putative long-chain fatty acid outer membrane transporter [Nitrospira lenta]|uniref:Putative long-chain fatty acid outer membrane transporter n=1 Tax=Nitrospira lenta TaxID=1436998 RepID=A0A330LC71_9BACT|nr:putative long-chain fatty acid outer membrane transporter [Nitrospira lenta]